jgi:decaprenyl-phosphate phosphoribosyltransferase
MAVIILYVALQVAHNIRLKYVRLVDVATVASGFVLRAVAGAAALAIQVSIWLVVVVFVLTLFLGFVKRLSDLRVAEAARARGESLDWKPRAGYSNSEDLNWLLAVTGTSTVLTYLMYALSSHARHIFGMRALGFALLTPLVLVVIHRMYTRANDGLSESPTTVLREDRSAAVAALLYVAGVVAFLYWPPAEQLVARIFQDLP